MERRTREFQATLLEALMPVQGCCVRSRGRQTITVADSDSMPESSPKLAAAG